MIVGHVTARREAVIALPMITALGTTTIDVIVDTGFTEFLTVPPALIASLALPALNATAMTLADGSVIAVDVYEAGVLWDGQKRTVKIHSADGDPLVGMALLYGYRLNHRRRRRRTGHHRATTPVTGAFAPTSKPTSPNPSAVRFFLVVRHQ